MVVMNRKLNQHTLFNCHDAYSPQLNSQDQQETSLQPFAQEYLQCLRHWESLYSKYRAAVDNSMQAQSQPELFLKVKQSTHSYCLSAKGTWLGLACMANSQLVQRPIEDIINEKLAVCRENLDFSFHHKLL